MAVYGYCRVSTLKQANEGESLEVQRRQLRGYAEMHGLVIDRGDALIEVYQYLTCSDLRCTGSLVRGVEYRTLIHYRSPHSRLISLGALFCAVSVTSLLQARSGSINLCLAAFGISSDRWRPKCG